MTGRGGFLVSLSSRCLPRPEDDEASAASMEEIIWRLETLLRDNRYGQARREFTVLEKCQPLAGFKQDSPYIHTRLD